MQIIFGFFTPSLLLKETKQQPGTAGPGNMIGCCLVYFHFLWAILWPHPVLFCAPGFNIRTTARSRVGRKTPLARCAAKLQREIVRPDKSSAQEERTKTIPVPHWRQQPIWLVSFVPLSSLAAAAAHCGFLEGEIRNYDYFPDKTRPKFRRRRRPRNRPFCCLEATARARKVFFGSERRPQASSL